MTRSSIGQPRRPTLALRSKRHDSCRPSHPSSSDASPTYIFSSGCLPSQCLPSQSSSMNSETRRDLQIGQTKDRKDDPCDPELDSRLSTTGARDHLRFNQPSEEACQACVFPQRHLLAALLWRVRVCRLPAERASADAAWAHHHIVDRLVPHPRPSDVVWTQSV